MLDKKWRNDLTLYKEGSKTGLRNQAVKQPDSHYDKEDDITDFSAAYHIEQTQYAATGASKSRAFCFICHTVHPPFDKLAHARIISPFSDPYT